MNLGSTKLALLALSIVFSACGASDSSSAPPATTPTATAQEAATDQATATAGAAVTPTPRESPVAASAPPGPHGVGDKVLIDDYQYLTIEEVILWPGNGALQPSAGNKIISARVEIEGIDLEGSAYNPLYFKVKDSAGFEYLASPAPWGQEPSLKAGTSLAAGEIVAGWVSFEVPRGVGSLTLQYEGIFVFAPPPVKVILPAL